MSLYGGGPIILGPDYVPLICVIASKSGALIRAPTLLSFFGGVLRFVVYLGRVRILAYAPIFRAHGYRLRSNGAVENQRLWAFGW